MTDRSRQLPLDLDYRPALGRTDYLVSDSNRALVAQILHWTAWPGRRMALIGPRRSGKTHLAHVWMNDAGAEAVEAMDLDNAAAERLTRFNGVVVENVDRLDEAPDRRVAEEALLHLYNLLTAEGRWLMVTGTSAPGRWDIRLPDLASRLQAMPVARIEPPDDALLSSILIKLFADRQVPVGKDVVRSLVLRMERSIAEAERLVEMLDRQALAQKKRVTRTMAIDLLETMSRGADKKD